MPVVSIGADTIQTDGAQNISDILNELPQVGICSTRTNTNFLTSGTGIATVNLRCLGNSRTLTLVNGRRFISGFAGDLAVDLNNIPTDLIQRVCPFFFARAARASESGLRGAHRGEFPAFREPVRQPPMHFAAPEMAAAQ